MLYVVGRRKIFELMRCSSIGKPASVCLAPTDCVLATGAAVVCIGKGALHWIVVQAAVARVAEESTVIEAEVEEGVLRVIIEI